MLIAFMMRHVCRAINSAAPVLGTRTTSISPHAFRQQAVLKRKPQPDAQPACMQPLQTLCVAWSAFMLAQIDISR